MIGAAITFSSFTIGWVLFAVAGWRAQVFPRPAAALLIVGAIAGLLAGPLFQIPLALGVAWIGLSLGGSPHLGPRGASTVATDRAREP